MQPVPRLTLQHVPFLRPALPLVLGIVCQCYVPTAYGVWVVVAVAVVAAVMAVATRRESLQLLHRCCMGVTVWCMMMAAGMAGYEASRPQAQMPDVADDAVVVARVEEQPAQRLHTMQVEALIVAVNDSTTTREAHLPVMLYMEPSHRTLYLQRGDLILYRPALRPAREPELPHAFDFARYMQLRGINYTQYLHEADWRLLPRTAHLTLKDRAQHLQRRCVDNLYSLGLGDEAASLLAAVVWGYKNDIPEDVRDCFSAAGLSHVLAVSGLHTGIIAFVLWLLFYPLRYTPLRSLRRGITLVCLWGYAFVTGLSPSVVRACVMASFVGVAHMMGRRNSTLNALFAAATFTLVVAPQQLFDVGFQLSYLAVIGIVLLAPYIDLARRMECHSEGLRYVSGILSVSIAAQAATTMLAAFYFHTIPLWGLVANMLFVPLLPLPIFATLCAQALQALHLPCAWLAAAAEWLTSLLITGADTIAAQPTATITDVWLTLPMLACYGVVLYCVWCTLREQHMRYVPHVTAALIVLQGLYIYDNLRHVDAQCLVATTARSTTLQLYDEERNAVVVSTDTLAMPHTGDELRRRNDFVARRAGEGDTVATPHIYVVLPFVQYYDSRLLWVDNDEWRYAGHARPMKVDCAVITEHYNGRIADLCRSFDIEQVVLAAAIFPERAQRLQHECDALGIACHDIRRDGLWVIKR